MRRDVFQAIADPTRREIIHLIAKENMNLNAVAEKFDVSRPAISKHIKILTECGLITIHQQGRERICEAKLQKLNEVNQWVAQYKQFWESKFDALEAYLAKLQSESADKEQGKAVAGAKKKNTTSKKEQHGKRKQKRKSNR